MTSGPKTVFYKNGCGTIVNHFGNGDIDFFRRGKYSRGVTQTQFVM